MFSIIKLLVVIGEAIPAIQKLIELFFKKADEAKQRHKEETAFLRRQRSDAAVDAAIGGVPKPADPTLPRGTSDVPTGFPVGQDGGSGVVPGCSEDNQRTPV